MMSLVEPNAASLQSEDMQNPKLVYVRALYNYFPIGKDELAIEQSDVFLASDAPPRNGWALGMKGGVWGWYPEEYVTKLSDKELEEFKKKEIGIPRLQSQLAAAESVEDPKLGESGCKNVSTAEISGDIGVDTRSSLLRSWINKYATVLGRRRKGNKIRSGNNTLKGSTEVGKAATQDSYGSYSPTDGSDSFGGAKGAAAMSLYAKSSVESSEQEGKTSARKEHWHGLVTSLRTLHHRLFSRSAIKRSRTYSTGRDRKGNNKADILSSSTAIQGGSQRGLCQSGMTSEDLCREDDNQSDNANGSQGSSSFTAAGDDGRTTVRSPLSPLAYREKVISELISTERTYVDDLDLIINLYIIPIKESGYLQAKDIDILFSNVESLHSVNKSLLDTLENEVFPKHGPPVKTLGDVLLSVAGFFKIYTMYCSNLPYAFLKLRSFRESESISKYINQCSTHPRSRGFTLSMFMIRPVLRICKYPAFLNEILKYTPPDNDDYESLKKAKERIDTVVAIVDEASHNTHNMIELCELQEKFSNKINIVSPNRRLLISGIFRVAAQKLADSYNVPSSGDNRGVYLFNDMLLLAKLHRDTDKKLKYYKMLSFDNLVIKRWKTFPGCLRIFKNSCMCYTVYFNDEKVRDTWMEQIVGAKRALVEAKIKESQQDLNKMHSGKCDASESPEIQEPIHADPQSNISDSGMQKCDGASSNSTAYTNFPQQLPATDTTSADANAPSLTLAIDNPLETHKESAIDTPPIYAEYCTKEGQCRLGDLLALPPENPDSPNTAAHGDEAAQHEAQVPVEAMEKSAIPKRLSCTVSTDGESSPTSLASKAVTDGYLPCTPKSDVSIEMAMECPEVVPSMLPIKNKHLPQSEVELMEDPRGQDVHSQSAHDQGIFRLDVDDPLSDTHEQSGTPQPSAVDNRLVESSDNIFSSRTSNASQSHADDTINEPAMKYVGFTLSGEDSDTEFKFSARRKSSPVFAAKRKAAPKPPKPLKLAYIDEPNTVAPSEDKREDKDASEGPYHDVIEKNTYTYADPQPVSNLAILSDTTPQLADEGSPVHPDITEPPFQIESGAGSTHEVKAEDEQAPEHANDKGAAGILRDAVDPTPAVGLSVSDIETEDPGFECISRPVKSATITNVYIADDSVVKYLQNLHNDKKRGDVFPYSLGASGTKYLYSMDVEYVYKRGQTINATIYRTYENFFDLHLNLMGNFTVEAGISPPTRKGLRKSGNDPQSNGAHCEPYCTRVLPLLPCQIMVVTSETARLRIVPLQGYIDSLLKLSSNVSRSPYVLSFFRPVKMRIKTTA